MLIEGVMLPLLFGVKLFGVEYLVISGYSFLGLLGTPVSVICWTSGLGLTSTISGFRLCRMCGISYGVWIACSPKLNRHCWYVRLLCCACAFSIWLLQWSMLDADSDIRFLSRLVLIISSLTIFGYFCPRLISSSTWLVFNLCLWFTDSPYIGSYEFSPANYRFFIPSKGVCHNISRFSLADCLRFFSWYLWNLVFNSVPIWSLESTVYGWVWLCRCSTLMHLIYQRVFSWKSLFWAFDVYLVMVCWWPMSLGCHFKTCLLQSSMRRALGFAAGSCGALSVSLNRFVGDLSRSMKEPGAAVRRENQPNLSLHCGRFDGNSVCLSSYWFFTRSRGVWDSLPL